VSSERRTKRNQDYAKFEKAFQEIAAPESLSPVERTVWGILARSGSPARATAAFESLCSEFVDINEMRVAKLSDLAARIGSNCDGDPTDTAYELRGFLRQIFNDNFRVDFEFAREMERDKVRKYIASRPGFGPEIAFGLILEAWSEFLAPAADAEGNGEVGAKKPTEREIDSLVTRLRILYQLASPEKDARKGQVPNFTRLFLERWSPAHGSYKRITAERDERKAAAAKAAAEAAETARKEAEARARAEAKAEAEAAKKLAAAKAVAAKKAAAKRAANKAAAAKKAAIAIRAMKKAAKKAMASKAAAQKIASKKVAAQKAAAKKAAPKKVAAKKVTKSPAKTVVKKAAKKATKKVAKKAAKKAPAKTSAKKTTRAATSRAATRTARARPRATSKKSSRR